MANPKKFRDFIDADVSQGLKELGKDFRGFSNAVEATIKSIQTIADRTGKKINKLEGDIKKTIKSFESADLNTDFGRSELDKAEKSASELTKAHKELTEAQKGQKTTQDALKGSVKAMETEVKKLTKEFKALSPAQRRNSEQSKELKKRLIALKTSINEASRSTSRLNKEFKSSEGSYNALVQQNKRIKAILDKLPISFINVNKRAKQLKNTLAQNTLTLKKFDSEINRNFRNVGNYGSALSGLPGILGRVGSQTQVATSAISAFGLGLVGVLAGLGAVVAIASKVFSVNRELSDSFADVEKTTGLSADQVRELGKELSNIDTRTSLKGLLEIAEIGGRLNIAEKDLFSFTKAVDVAAVSLGDEFSGGLEEVATNLGKLTKLFKETRNLEVDDAFNKVGSAINELGSNTAGTADNITDFALRIGQLPESLRPSQQDALSLGAAFEEVGINAEQAARPLSIFLTRAAGNAAGFARQIGITEQAAKDLINTDVTEFTKQFSLSLRGLNATQTAAVFTDLGLKADGVRKVLGALSNQTERLTEIQQISNDAYDKGSSLLDEFEKKNNTLAGELTKLGNAFDNLFVSSGAEEFFKEFISGLNATIRLLADENVSLFEFLAGGLDPVARAMQLAEKAARDLGKQQQEAANKANVHAAALMVLNDETGAYLKQLEFENSTLKDNTFLAEVNAEVQKLRGVEADEASRKAAAAAALEAEKAAEAAKKEKERLEQLKKLTKEFEKLKSIINDLQVDPIKLDLGIDIDDLESTLPDLDGVFDRVKASFKKLQEGLTEVQRSEQEKRDTILFESFNLTNTILDSVLQLSSARNQNELAMLEEKRDSELQLAEGNQVAQAEINDRFDERQKQLRQKQAQRDKNIALFRVPINVATGITAALTNPATAPFVIPFIVATGLVQAATIAATPLPQFFQGVEDLHKDTLGTVGEQGRELLREGKTGPWKLSPPKTTLAYLPKGSEVIPNPQTEQILQSLSPAMLEYGGMQETHANKQAIIKNLSTKMFQVGFDDSRLLSSNQSLSKQMGKVNESIKNITMLSPAWLDGQVHKSLQKKNERKTYLNDRLRK